jgi:hypothetical protein
MSLSPSERERVKYHLGYLGTSTAASIQYGLSRPIQTLFLVESAMTNVMEESVDRIRRILHVMDGIEEKLVEAQDRLAAMRLGDLELRETEPDQLEHEYARWGNRLADLLGVPPYYYSPRYRGNGTKAGTVPVR